MSQIAENCHYTFQQYSTPAHNNKSLQAWLKEILTEV
jgi:hypothetical protein